MTGDAVTRSLEAVLFVADEPLSSATLAQAAEVDREEAERRLEALAEDLAARGSGVVLRRVAGGWRLFSSPDAAGAVERFVVASRHSRLTRASLETLAIVAYKQPVTRHQVSSIRGVDSEGVLRSLVDRRLVAEVGREEGPGRPVLYGTTADFLERLGLASVGDLPPLTPLLGDNEPDGSGGSKTDADGSEPGERGAEAS